MIHQGDSLTVLRTLPDESAQCCVTSPPYWGLRDYGVPGQLGLERTPEEYVARMVEVFREVRRVLRRDGTLWLNMGDSYCGDRGQQDNGGRPVNGKTLSRRRDNAPIPRSDTRIAGLKPKDLVGMPWRLAFALQSDGWWLRSDIVWAKSNPMPERVTDRPTKSHEYLFLLSRSERYYYDADAIRTPLQPKTFTTFGTTRKAIGDGSGLVKSENYGATVPERRPRLATDREAAAAAAADGSSTTRRREGLNARWDERERAAGDGHGPLIDHVAEARRNGADHDTTLTPLAGANAKTVWTIATTPYPEAHFATFPEALVEPCILAGSAIGDVVLDPFLGSGTTLAVAKRLGREGVGIELSPAYIALAERRIARVTYQPVLPLSPTAAEEEVLSEQGTM